MDVQLTPELKEALVDEGYRNIQEIPGQGICALGYSMFTVDLVCHIDWTGRAYRYMYHTLEEAYVAMGLWSGKDHPPGNWVKRKGGGDISNPEYKDPRLINT